MMRKLSFKILALLAVIGLMLCAGAMAEEVTIVDSGYCGNSVFWTLDIENTLTISGTGKMDDYEYNYAFDFSDAPWNGWRNSIKKVIIEDGVTSIGNVSFMYCPSLESITIPDSVTEIGSEAFFYCIDLTSITLPDNLTSIGNIAFYDCDGLTSIVIPDSVTFIGDEAFTNCDGLTSIIIPDGIASIGSGTFNNCSNLTSISIPDTVTSIGNSAFSGCSSLTGITIPDSVTSIGESAFRGCSSLTSIAIPDGVASICNYAFYGCTKVENIDIPDSVTSIGNYAFGSCSSLTKIDLPDGITSIGNSTFGYCSGLTKIDLPDGITSIGDAAFRNCTKLTGITIPDGVTSIGKEAFYYCSSLTSISIPDTVTSIGEKTFYYCSSLTSISIPDSLASIGSYAFYYCGGLTSIAIPDSVTSIGSYAFHQCKNLNDVYAGSVESWLNIAITDDYSNPMYYADNLYFNNELAVNIIVPDGVTSVGNYAFYRCSSLTSISIPDSVTSIGDYAFYKCSSLTDISIPDSVASIGPAAFWYCSSLTDIAVPDGVSSISASAFRDCSSLTSISIPDTVTFIGNWAFSGSSSLTKVYLLGDEAPKFTFSNYFNKSNVTIYCHEFSEIDFWVAESGYKYVYVDPDAPESLSIVRSSETGLYPGETLNIRVSTFPLSAANYPIVWESSDSGVIEIENGVPTAVSEGTANITASCGGLSDSVTVTVIPTTTPKSLTLPADVRIDIDSTLTVQAVTSPLDASEYEILWESSDPEVATVENGVVTPVSVGTTTITASCEGVSDSMEITVYAELKSFELSASELWIVSKTTAQLTVENVLPAGATGYTLTWESSDASVLTVDGGAITAKVPGDAVVTVTSDNGISRQCIVHVCYPVIAIAFEDTQIALSIGETAQLTANVTTRNETLVNKLVTFASSDESVVTVDENGVATAVASGSATISATSSNAITAKCSVIVHNSSVLTLPASLTVIEDEAFEGLGVGTVVLPEGATTIGSRAFADCDELTIVHMPDSVVSIADDAFEGCEKVTFLCASENAAAEYAGAHGIKCRIAQ